MLPVKTTLLGFAAVAAVASTGNNFHAAADLTPKDATYDGMTMYILATVGEIETLVDTQKNTTFSSEFVTAKNKILNQATVGVLNPQAYACFMYTFYKSANVAYQDFSGYVAKNLPNVKFTTEKYIKTAPTYWWDFYSDKMSTVATTVNNKQLTSLYTAMDTKVEADVKSGASASTINDKIATFLTSADALSPTYSTKVGDAWTTSMTNIIADFKENANCPGVAPLPTSSPTTTTPSPTSVSITKAPTETPSPTEDTTTTESPISDPTPAPTASEANPISTQTAAPASTAGKAIATTTAPPAKSSASKTASTVASAVTVLVTFAASSLI